MRLIGLTGSIGMGKSATANMFREAGVPVFDADAAVHEIYRQAPTAAFREAFADAIVDDAIDRAKLAAMMVADPTRLPQLERIVHPLVGASRAAFLDDARTKNCPCVVLDIPLLMETKAEGAVDVVVVVSAPADMQRERTLARPGMTPEKFAMIMGKQVPDVEKAPPRAFRHRYRIRLSLCSASGRGASRRDRLLIVFIYLCAKSSSTRKPPGSILQPAIASSRSAPSRSSTRLRPAAASTPISIRSATCRTMPSASTACPRSSSPNKPLFHTVVGDFLAFVEDAPLVIHNAEFDIRFLDHELTSAGHPPLGFSRAIDTLAIARRKHVGASNSLDSLCARYGISTTHRVLHGALLDAQLLADVYLELSGGMQSSFSLHVAADAALALARNGLKARPAPLAIIMHADEQAAHEALIATLGTTALWQKFRQPATSALN